ncbi:UDP-glycosyltransferase 79B9 [Camellia lanceoleosa]|uniref:UDP-glycosyltransferase 79B9 n=1 Tax=Camellia lanceoleosa TaxID=1840588 RepID=A0ACC0IIP7_9ERIC|nr:UDP-glycosyltransferase 79B9 [Camellia lanceoleosa]
MDLTCDQVETLLRKLKPNVVLFDAAHWIPELASKIGFMKTVFYNVVSAVTVAIQLVPARKVFEDMTLMEAEIAKPPPGYPSSTVVLRRHEALAPPVISFEFGRGITLHGRFTTSMKECDAISIRTCQQIEGQFCDYIGSQYGKPMFLTGPVLYEVMKMERPLEDQWARWLEGVKPNSIVFCAFGSQLILEKDQFQELVLGGEREGLPQLRSTTDPVDPKPSHLRSITDPADLEPSHRQFSDRDD